MLYEWEQPFVMSSEKFQQAFGVTPTPLREAVQATVEWARTHPQHHVGVTGAPTAVASAPGEDDERDAFVTEQEFNTPEEHAPVKERRSVDAHISCAPGAAGD